MNVIPKPLNAGGTLEYLIFSRIAAIAKIAKNQPIPEPTPYVNAKPKEGISLDCINKLPPKIAQFTAINGKKIPNELYNDGENFSTIISTNCTIVAMVAINIINDKKLKS